MKNITILLAINLFLSGCASTCMEYRSATTAARTEKNLTRAEEWGLKAISSPECDPANDANAPYFLATEVYLKQKKYVEMAEMLNLAEKRNSEGLLETPFRLGDTPITTIQEGVNAYRDQEWAKIYNKVVELVNKDEIDNAKEQIEIAILIHPQKSENYSTLAAIHLQNEDMDAALSTANRGLESNSNSSILNQLKADILLQGTPDPKAMNNAVSLYKKSIKYADDPGPVMRKLLFVYIDLGDNQQAIDYSNELLDKFPNDADIYYNIGVLYQRLTVEMFDPARELFLETTESSSKENIKKVYDSFKTARIYAYNSKDYFLQAGDLELDENISTRDAVQEMSKLMDQIDELFMPSIRETARSAKVNLE